MRLAGRRSLNRAIWTLALGLVVVFCAGGICEEVKNLSLKEAIRTALENNLGLKRTQEAVIGSKAVVGEVRSEWYPGLNLSLGMGFDETLSVAGEPQTFEFLGQTYEIHPPLTSQWSNSLCLGLSQNIYTGGRLTGSLREAEANLRIAECDHETAKRGLILEVMKAYWELVRADLLVRLAEEMVSYHQETLELATSRLSQGTIAPVEVEQAKVDLANQRDELIQARTRRREVEDELKVLLNIGFKIGIVPTDKPDFTPLSRIIDMDEAIECALKRRPELARFRHQVQARKAALMAAKSGRYPKVSVVANYGWAGMDKDYADALQNFKATRWGIGLNVNYALFDGGLTQSRIKEAESGLARAEYGRTEKEKEIVKEVREAFHRLTSASERIETMRENVGLAQENLRIAKLQFNVGTITSNDVNEYKTTLSKVKTRFIEAIIDYQIARARFNWAVGIAMEAQ
ncbi:MAG: TolC family protein [bacterium]|nr:TolC family protein [bacterium]